MPPRFRIGSRVATRNLTSGIKDQRVNTQRRCLSAVRARTVTARGPLSRSAPMPRTAFPLYQTYSYVNIATRRTFPRCS